MTDSKRQTKRSRTARRIGVTVSGVALRDGGLKSLSQVKRSKKAATHAATAGAN